LGSEWLSAGMKLNIGNVLHTVTLLCCYSFGDIQRYMHLFTAHAWFTQIQTFLL